MRPHLHPAVRLSDVRPGQTLIADDGFTCLNAGPHVVQADDRGRLFVPCRDGRHMLDGQEDEPGAPLIGFAQSSTLEGEAA